MFTRKSLFVALTVIAMLAMLVPATFAAPEVLTGLAITAPTTVNPELITTPTNLGVDYVLTIAGTQVNDVVVQAWLEDDYGNPVTLKAQNVHQADELVTGANAESITVAVPALADGWYDVVVCAIERNENGLEISDPCATQENAVRVDNTRPEVIIERPVRNEGCTWVTGQEYELFGMATDNVEVDRAWFEFSPSQNPDDVIQIGNEDANNVAHDATPVAGFPGEYTALWDSSQVPDGTGAVQFCAADTAGNEQCSGFVFVCVENRIKIDLVKGWNLISTPLLLYDGSIADVLAHVWNPMTGQLWNQAPIDAVVTTRDGGATWMSWMAGAPGSLTEIQDGYGYWVHTVAPAQIEFVGTWLSVGPNAPPEYPVHEGWNLIGYTHFGTPTMGPWPEFNKTVADYLGFPMMVSVESMYRYDAARGLYIQVDEMFGERFMMQGAGYWLALAEGTEGTINP